MLFYVRTDISEGIDVTKSSDSKECTICHYWYFKHGFKFQKSFYNGCHDLLMLSLDIRDITSDVSRVFLGRPVTFWSFPSPFMKPCASRCSKNALPGHACSQISL